jgi:hypothetical protein
LIFAEKRERASEEKMREKFRKKCLRDVPNAVGRNGARDKG